MHLRHVCTDENKFKEYKRLGHVSKVHIGEGMKQYGRMWPASI